MQNAAIDKTEIKDLKSKNVLKFKISVLTTVSVKKKCNSVMDRIMI